jgi:H+-transporting ATPase
MIEAAVILSGVVQALAGFLHHPLLLFSNAVVAFWEEHQAGNAIAALKASWQRRPGEARWKWATPKAVNWCPATSFVCGWATSCRRMRACWRAIRCKWISPR